MQLHTLVKALNHSGVVALEGDANPQIRHLAYNSQEIGPGGLFVAVTGFRTDGHGYIADAIARGAAAVVGERDLSLSVPYVRVPNSRLALSGLAACFFGDPSQQMCLIGITGTNGKTTMTYLVERILLKAGFEPGVIGTINYRFGEQVHANPVTTPESLDLQNILVQMAQAGTTHVVMEVSSHAIDLHRVDDCQFDMAVFTNLTQDHLDYHHTMQDYWACKQRLFTDLLTQGAKAPTAQAVINTLSPQGQELISRLQVPSIAVGGPNHPHGVWADDVAIDLQGIHAMIQTPVGAFKLDCPLVGAFNLENLLGAVGVGVGLGIDLEHIHTALTSIPQIPGRLESIVNGCQRHVFVDYAHTPDALENALLALKPLTRGRLISIFGCGGDRDAAKRSIMGDIAARLSDLVIITSDNPRSEVPLDIMAQIREGVTASMTLTHQLPYGWQPGQYAEIEDRRLAIQTGVAASKPQDTILIAGKGHETYQLIGRRRLDFDDREEARQALGALLNENGSMSTLGGMHAIQ